MLIAPQIAQLPEVGHGTVADAKKLDARQKILDQEQAALNADRREFLEGLRGDWTDEEFRLAGVFI